MSNLTDTEIGIIVALKEEFRELFGEDLDLETERTPAGDVYYHFRVGDGDAAYQCTAVFLEDMGPTTACLATERLCNRFAPRTLVNLGIAGSLKSELLIGDVVVAESVNAYMEKGKADDGERVFVASGRTTRATEKFRKFFNNFEHANAVEFCAWQEDSQRWALEHKLHHLGDKVHLKPRLVTGPIASGPLVVSGKNFRSAIQDVDRKLCAVEMEAAGIMRVAELRDVQTLIMKGISDAADHAKSEEEMRLEGANRRFALRNLRDLFFAACRHSEFRRKPTFEATLTAPALKRGIHKRRTVFLSYPLSAPQETQPLLDAIRERCAERGVTICEPTTRTTREGYESLLNRVDGVIALATAFRFGDRTEEQLEATSAWIHNVIGAAAIRVDHRLPVILVRQDGVDCKGLVSCGPDLRCSAAFVPDDVRSVERVLAEVDAFLDEHLS